MKKVELGKPDTKIYLRDVTDNMIVGIQFSDGTRVLPVKLGSSNWVSTEVIDNGRDFSSKVSGESIQGLIKRLGEVVVYVFDTKNELLEWLKN